ncbi:hypothetical protein OG777_29320 [Micromonospora peucetia]|uniref:Uncharacterized protein n=1 Tax=Micromonospora peucetia TaxID=47871 RepID=A0A1C6W1L5_9ACTN|nr:hypothetical protein [Micromonospora peucetia]MCX4391004.1 hypothetical protein [Micromonospora peucetia]WSA31934.1 hypothetical protein OIE14_28070 [Micromonospora peucetia]SCL72406.1 hypothetical protein GA0070608_4987 [Micromonospora peucetia]
MKYDFTRWLPAIAKDSKDPKRKIALSVVGVAALGGLALAPTAVAAPVTTTPHEGAVAAIEQATGMGRPGAAEESALTTGGTTTKPAADKPSREELIPHGVQGAQSRVPLDDAQLANAKAIIQEAKDTGVGERGAVIGIATSLQESKLYNLGHLGAYNDHDSQGLFQQRPSSGWGSPDEITDPEYASQAFFQALKNVGGWQNLPLTSAAQTVQVSAYPFAYAQWEEQAADVVSQLW